MKRFTNLLLILFAASALSSPAIAQKTTLTLVHIAIPGSPYTQAAQDLANRIDSVTDGQVKVNVSTSLLKGTQIAPAVRDGRIDIAGMVNPYLSGDEPRMSLQNLVGLIENMDEYKLVFDAFWGEELKKVWYEKYNSVVLAEGAFCPQMVYSKSPIRTVEDFQGLKIRTHNVETAKLMNLLGAEPVSIPFSEVMPGIQRGVIDGVITASCAGYGLELWKVAKNVQNWFFAPIQGWALVVNRESWAKIPMDLQNKIMAEGKAIQDIHFADYSKLAAEAIKNFQAQGVKYYEAPESELAKVYRAKLSDPIYEDWYERADASGFDGRSFVKKARAAIGK